MSSKEQTSGPGRAAEKSDLRPAPSYLLAIHKENQLICCHCYRWGPRTPALHSQKALTHRLAQQLEKLHLPPKNETWPANRRKAA